MNEGKEVCISSFCRAGTQLQLCFDEQQIIYRKKTTGEVTKAWHTGQRDLQLPITVVRMLMK